MSMQLACTTHAPSNATRMRIAMHMACKTHCEVQCKSDALSREPCARDSREEVETEKNIRRRRRREETERAQHAEPTPEEARP